MPATLEQLEAQRRKTEEAAGKYTAVAGTGPEFMNRVKEELRKRAAERGVGALTETAAGLRKEFMAAPAAMRETYAGADPYARMTAVGARRGDIASQLEMIAAQQEARTGRIEDVLGYGERGLEATGAQAAAGLTAQQQLYQNLAQELAQQQATEQWGAEFGETQRWHNIQAELERARIGAAGAGGAAGAPSYAVDLPGFGTIEVPGSTAWSIYKEMSERAGEADEFTSEGLNALSKANRAIQILEEGHKVSGPVSAWQARTGARWGGIFAPSTIEDEYQMLVGDLGTREMFAIGGKVLPSQEIDRLRTFIPEGSLQERSALDKLYQFREDLIDRYGLGEAEGWTGAGPGAG